MRLKVSVRRPLSTDYADCQRWFRLHRRIEQSALPTIHNRRSRRKHAL